MESYNIAILTDYINLYMGGHSKNIYYLCKSIEKIGHSISVFCKESDINKESKIKKTYIHNSRFPDIEVAKIIRNREKEFDFIYSNICYGYPYLLFHNRPFIVHFRASHLRLLKSSLNSRYFSKYNINELNRIFYYGYSGLVDGFSAMKADLAICNSYETEYFIKKYYNISPKKLKVIPNGIDLESFRTTSNCIRELKYETGHKRVLLFVGRLSLDKNLDRLIDAMRAIVKIRQDILLIIVGGGELYNKIDAIISSSNLRKFIKLIGHIDNKSIIDYYYSADLFVCTSSPGTTLLEAMAAGKPFIVYRKRGDNSAGVLVEKIKKEGIGIFLEECDLSIFVSSILNVIDDDRWLSDNGARGLRFVENNLNWDKIAIDTIELISKLINTTS